MSDVSEEETELVLENSNFEEAQQLADRTGRGVEWWASSQYSPYEPTLGFFEFYRLRLWLYWKRAGWAIKRRIRNIIKFARGNKT